LLVEPVSVAKAARLSAIDLNGIFMITPNEDELASVAGSGHSSMENSIRNLFDRGIACCWLRKGAAGSVVFKREGSLNFPAIPLRVTDSTGAGDAALAGWVAARYHGLNEEDCTRAGHVMGHEVLQVTGAVIPNIHFQQLKDLLLKYYPHE
jgi:sugar/nucleoside kinase (ribokinase family)